MEKVVQIRADDVLDDIPEEAFSMFRDDDPDATIAAAIADRKAGVKFLTAEECLANLRAAINEGKASRLQHSQV